MALKTTAMNGGNRAGTGSKNWLPDKDSNLEPSG